MAKRKNTPVLMFIMVFLFIGLFLILDGFFSITFQLDDPYLFQIGRAIRLGIGFFVFMLSFLMIMSLRKKRKKSIYIP